MSTFTSLEDALKHHFGYDTFRPGQKKIIQAALQNKDLLTIMPTGGGEISLFSATSFTQGRYNHRGFSTDCLDAGSG